MTRTPVADWQRLSELYEVADALEPHALDEWLAGLQQQAHPMLPQLRQMLEARSQNRDNGFLDALPHIPTTPEPRAIEWHGGDRIGLYRLARKIGSGGMADVWLAHRDDGAFERQVAIKLLFRDACSRKRDTFAQRFERERDILASLNHPHIAGLHDAGVTPSGQPWLALEYVEGEMLTTWCDTHRLGIEARVRLFRQALLAVQHAHANLVIHRDLKPGNILVTSEGGVRLLDFGIAKLMEPAGAAAVESELTRMAGRPMTPQYAAPEQLLGQPLTTACDVYALGVVLYELLCGERPYELKVESAVQLEQAILETEPRAPSRRALADPTAKARATTPALLRKRLASDLDAIVLRVLAKQPSRRYGSVEAMGADLDRWLAGEPVEARTPSTVYRIGKFVRRHTLSVSLSAAAVVSLLAIAAVAVVMGLQAREDSARAVAARDFMLNIFARANQEKSRGADITARDLLETGRKDVLTRLAGQPRLQAELLQGIAKIQTDMGEYASADGTYGELVRMYAALRDPRQEAWARADAADNGYQMGNLATATTMLQQAREVRGRPTNDPELNARFGELDGWLAIGRGDLRAARESLLVARQHAKSQLGPDHLRTFRLGQALLRAEGQLRNINAALALHAELRQSAAQWNEIGAVELAAMDWEQAYLLVDAGNFARALPIVEAAIPRCDLSVGADEANCRMLFLMRGRILLRLGLIDVAARDMSRLAGLAGDQKWAPLRVEAMILQLRLVSRTHLEVDSNDLAKRAAAMGVSGEEVPMNPAFKANALLALAESSLLRGDPGAAQDWLQLADAKLATSTASASNAKLAAVARGLWGVARLQRGDAEGALQLLTRARMQFGESFGADHTMTQLMALNNGLALEMLGRPAEALAIVAHAQPILLITLGSSSPEYQRVLSFRQRLEASPGERVGVRSSTNTSSGGAPSAVRPLQFFS